MAVRETIAGSGSRLTRAYYTVEATQLEQLSGPPRGPGTRRAMRSLRCSRLLRGWAARSHTRWAAHQGYASCRKQR